ncbi:hypothetical protein [Haladaptatus sp. AB643]|uniref:hypothetical protein n=1 Tax=Haladaptatus sp. AB643 TaxID=2934174 RepID=UPI00209C1948|nr:hypothetical protein [Haladaptatus sp. AB643]MCO8244373.1 hypothetical protein [Haladaptatus sp. AB643]
MLSEKCHRSKNWIRPKFGLVFLSGIVVQLVTNPLGALGYVVLLTYWEPLRPLAYVVFGISYFIYAVASYGILRGA